MNNSLFHQGLVQSDRIIYTPSAFARENLFFLQEVGRLTAKKMHTSQRKNLNSLLFFIVEKGTGILVYQEKEYQLTPGMCVFINCQSSYLHQTSEKLWTLEWLHFFGQTAEKIYDKYQSRGGRPCFRTHDLQQYEQRLINIKQSARSNSYTRDMKIFSEITELLNLLMEETWYGNQIGRKGKYKKIDEVKNFIDQNYQSKINLNLLAQKFFIDKFYLSKSFKREFDITINQYLIQTRITHAKRLLRFTNKPIEQIAPTVGFPDANYFARIFKKTEKTTPGHFRDIWQANHLK